MRKLLFLLILPFLIMSCGADNQASNERGNQNITVNGDQGRHVFTDGFYEDGVYNFVEGHSAKGLMINEKKEGLWVVLNVYGRLKAKGDYKLDRKQGPWVFYNDEGHLIMEGSYLDDRLQDTAKMYRDGGEMGSVGKFRDGEKIGVWEYYFLNGQLQSKGEMIVEDRTGRWDFWHENGEPKETRHYLGGANFLESSWDSAGKAMVVKGAGNYEFVEEGLLREKGPYRDSLPNGTWTFWDDKGALIGDVEYVNGAPLTN